jgi:hypothetical protein
MTDRCGHYFTRSAFEVRVSPVSVTEVASYLSPVTTILPLPFRGGMDWFEAGVVVPSVRKAPFS